MNTTVQLLDAVKAKCELASDYALAKELELPCQSISQYRKEKNSFGDDTAIRVAEILELEPASVLAAVYAERAKTEKAKAVWKNVCEKMGGIALSLLVGTAFTVSSPTPASAAGKERANSVYYVKSRRRLNPNPFLQILQPFLPVV